MYEDRMIQGLQRKIVHMQRYIEKMEKALRRRSAQAVLHSEFSKLLREKYPEIYWEIVEELKIHASKE